MALIILYCDECGDRIPHRAFRTGDAISHGELNYCSECKDGVLARISQDEDFQRQQRKQRELMRTSDGGDDAEHTLSELFAPMRGAPAPSGRSGSVRRPPAAAPRRPRSVRKAPAARPARASPSGRAPAAARPGRRSGSRPRGVAVALDASRLPWILAGLASLIAVVMVIWALSSGPSGDPQPDPEPGPDRTKKGDDPPPVGSEKLLALERTYQELRQASVRSTNYRDLIARWHTFEAEAAGTPYVAKGAQSRQQLESWRNRAADRRLTEVIREVDRMLDRRAYAEAVKHVRAFDPQLKYAGIQVRLDDQIRRIRAAESRGR